VSRVVTLLPWTLRLGRLAVAPRYWVMAGQATVSATSFLTNIFIAKLCGLATFGEYSTWQLLLLLALALQGAVITQPMQVVLGTLSARQRIAYGQLVLGLQVAFSGLAVAATALGASRLPQAATLLPAFLVLLAATGSQDTLRKLLLAEGKIQAALVGDVLSAGGQLLLLLLLTLRPAPATLAEVMWAVGLTTLPALLVGGKALGEWPVLSLSSLRRFGRRHWRQVRWLLPTALLQWSSANVLLVFAGWVGSPAVLGVLRLAQTAMGVFNLGLQAVENYALPRLSQSFYHHPVQFATQRAALTKKMLLAAGPLLALLALAAGPLVARFGPAGGAQYADLLRWCCVLYGAILVVYPLRLTVRLLADSRHYFGGYVLSIGASLASVRWLTAHYQASGVVLGWLLAQLVLGAYWALVLHRTNLVKPLGLPVPA
jgi:O-antigen/teichoic acid export membrane protein